MNRLVGEQCVHWHYP